MIVMRTTLFLAVFLAGRTLLNAATTVYFVVSNLWRIGQQHFILNKFYDQPAPTGTAGKEATPAKESSAPSGKAESSKSAAPAPKAGSRPPQGARRKRKRKR